MSKIDIINEALTLLGVDEISSLTENTAQAKTAVRLYPTCFKAAVLKRPWSFSRATSAQMAQDAADSLEGTPRYQIPVDARGDRGFLLGLVDGNGNEVSYIIEGALAVLDVQEGEPDAVHARYVRFPGEESLPPSFVKAFAAQLAADMCMTLTENATLAGVREQIARDLWSDAALQDSQLQTPQALFDENEMGAIGGR
jgi:hypothetical protein